MKRRITLIASVVAVLMIVSLGNSPVLAQNPPPTNGFGEFYRFDYGQTMSYNQMNSFSAWNGSSLLHENDESFNAQGDSYGDLEVFMIGEEYNSLVEQYYNPYNDMNDTGPQLDQSQYRFTYAQIRKILEESFSYSDSRYEWDADQGVITDENFTDSQGPFPRYEESIDGVMFNDTYNVIFEEMFMQPGSYNESFYMDIVNDYANVLFDVNVELGNDFRTYNIANQTSSYSVNSVNVSISADFYGVYNVTLYLGDEFDPNTPVFQTTANISISIWDTNVFYYESSDNRLFEFERERGKDFSVEISDTQEVFFPYDNSTTTSYDGVYANITISGYGSSYEYQNEWGVIFDWAPAMVNFGNNEFIQGDKFIYEGSIYGSMDIYNEYSDVNGSYWDSVSGDVEGDTTTTIEVARTFDRGFAALIYGEDNMFISQTWESSYGGTSSDSWTETKTKFNVGFFPTDNPDKELGIMFPPDYQIEFLGFFSIPEVGVNYYSDVIDEIVINGYVFNDVDVNVESYYYEGSFNMSGDAPVGPGGPGGPVLNEGDYNSDSWTFVNANATRTLYYDASTGSLLGITEDVNADISSSFTSYYNGTWEFDENRDVQISLTSESYLAVHPTKYLEEPPVTTSDNSTTDDNVSSTSDAGNGSDVPTLENPLPGFEFVVTATAIFGIMVIRKKKY